jgi:hypothetical protein
MRRKSRMLDEKFPDHDSFRSSCGGIAQLVERLVRNEKARGSNPLTSRAEGVEVKSNDPASLLNALAGA